MRAHMHAEKRRWVMRWGCTELLSLSSMHTGSLPQVHHGIRRALRCRASLALVGSS